MGVRLALGVLLAAASCAHAQTVATMAEMLDGRMRPGVEVSTFEHTELLYPTARVAASGHPAELEARPVSLDGVRFHAGGREYDLYDYLALDRVAGLLVLKDGRVAYEDYELGANAETRWASFSMAKSVTSTLLAAALKEGYIRSLEDTVGQYVPSLRGSVYGDVSLRDLLQMTSGVRWDETYTDAASDTRRLTAAQASRAPGASLGYMAGLGRAAAPGTVWNYNSGETNVAGAVVEGATHMGLAAYLERTLWGPLGMEHDATWWTESPGGMGLGGVGLAATLRDYGRFGLFAMRGGVVAGRQVVPPGWFDDAGRPRTVGGHEVPFGLLWWPAEGGGGAFEARGIFGQRIYVNPAERVVIVVLSARPKPTGANVVDDEAFFAAVVRAVGASGGRAAQVQEEQRP